MTTERGPYLQVLRLFVGVECPLLPKKNGRRCKKRKITDTTMNIVEILQWRYQLAMMRHPKCQAPEYLPVLPVEEQAFMDYFKDAASYKDGFHGGCKYNGVELRVIREES